MLGHEVLVGGDDALARPERLEDAGAGRLDAAGDLDDDADIAVVQDILPPVGEEGGVGAPPGAGKVPHEDAADHRAEPELVREFVFLALKKLVNAAADCAVAEQGGLDFGAVFRHGGLPFVLRCFL